MVSELTAMRRPACQSRRAIPIGLALALACLGSPPSALAFEADSRVCAEADSYVVTSGKAERKRLREEAKDDARSALARRLLVEAFGGRSTGALVPGSEDLGSARIDAGGAFATLRVRYGIDDRIDGGEFEVRGDRDKGEVAYCIPADRYYQARDDVRHERERRIQSMRSRFAQLESLIDGDAVDEASRTLADVEIAVVGEALEDVTYRSDFDGRERPFEVWLLEWGDRIDKGPQFSRHMLERAEELVAQGYLTEADRYLQQSLEVDRENEHALELRRSIHDRRVERAELLNEAAQLARVGRFAAADERLTRARELDAGDPEPLLATMKTVNGLRAEYLQLNPERSIVLATNIGSLGVDPDRITERIEQETGWRLESSPTLSFSVGANLRLSRFVVFTPTLGLGASNIDSSSIGGVGTALYSLLQVSAGIGLRSPRTPKRKYSLYALAGPAWEWGDVAVDVPSTLSGSSTQLGWFVQVGVEWGGGTFYLQQGLGFEDDTDSLIGWDDMVQIGGGFVF